MSDVYEIFIYQNGTIVGGASFSQVYSCDVASDPVYAVKLYDYPVTWLGQNRTYNQILIHKNGLNWAAFMATAGGSYIQADGAGAGKDLIDVYVEHSAVGKPLFVPNTTNAGPSASVAQYSGPTWDIKAYGVAGLIGEIMQGSSGSVDLSPNDGAVAKFKKWEFYPTVACMIDYIDIKRDGVLWARLNLFLTDPFRALPLGYLMTSISFPIIVHPQDLVGARAVGVSQDTCDCGAAASDYTVSRLGGPGHSDWCKVANKP